MIQISGGCRYGVIRALVLAPLLNGLCFFLAAFGIVEIAFTNPSNRDFKYRKKEYLSPFEGVRTLGFICE
jgi:hypothetical protein